MEKRITIFLGEFGSGKTEMAVNYALELKAAGNNTTIVDIDLVKPYFRTRENRKLLEQNGVRVVAPDARLSSADLPILPHNLVELFAAADTKVVMDVGGGESAIVLGQLKRYFDLSGYEALLVVNTKRPFTSTTEGIVHVLRRIEQVSRIKISGLVSNTNLGSETTLVNVCEGLKFVQEAGAELGLTVKWAVVPKWLEQEIKLDVPLFVLEPRTRYPWMD